MGLTLGGVTLCFGDLNDPECKLHIEECEVVKADEEISEPVEYYTDKKCSFSSRRNSVVRSNLLARMSKMSKIKDILEGMFDAY